MLIGGGAHAQNPLIMDQFTADPTARVFDGKMYVYPSHDILPPPGARADWFCMEDYHVFSSENLMDWTDHGVIVSQTNVPWVDAATYDGPEDHDRTLASTALPRQIEGRSTQPSVSLKRIGDSKPAIPMATRAAYT